MKIVTRISIISVSLIISLLFVNSLLLSSDSITDINKSIKATELAKKWFEQIGREKATRGIKNNYPEMKYGYLIGDEYTEITTTLGSLESKEISTNINFAGVLVKELMLKGISYKSKIGVTISGSFPALSISTLAALQTIGCEVFLISSVGASTYGANQLNFDWLDYERTLIKSGGLKYSSTIVTPGGDFDNSCGMIEDGIKSIEISAKRNNYKLYKPASLIQSKNYKTRFLISKKIELLINIGGNQASLGNCSHSASIPNGFFNDYKPCRDEDRGIIMEMLDRNIKVFNILNIKSLYTKFGLPVLVTNNEKIDTSLFKQTKANKLYIVLLIVFNLVLIILLRDKSKWIKL